jgi:alanyl-tRNA synthetase
MPAAKKAGVPNLIAFFGNRKGMNDEDAIRNCVVGLNRVKKGTSHDLGMVADKMLEDAMDINGTKIIAGALPEGVADEAVRTQLDRLRQKSGSCVIIVGWPAAEDKVTLIAAATEDVTAKGIHAGKLVGLAAGIVGGKGGGKPTLAQAGGKDPSKLEEAIETARNEAAAVLKR